MSRIGKWFGFDPEGACEEGLAALDRHDFESAARSFRLCIEEGTRESTVRLARFHLAECHSQLAEAEYHRADYSKARDELELAFAYAQPSAERHLLAARIARSFGDEREAAIHLQSALNKSPEHPKAIALQMAAWYEQGRTEETLAHVEKMPKEDRRLQSFHEAHERGDRVEAIGHLLALAAI